MRRIGCESPEELLSKVASTVRNPTVEDADVLVYFGTAPE